MKKTFSLALLLIGFMVLNSCKKSDNTSNRPTDNGQSNWNMTINSQNYSWTGPYPATGANNGLSTYFVESGSNPPAILALSSPSNGGVSAQQVAVSFSSARTGTFVMNPSTYNGGAGDNTFSLTLNSSTIYSSIAPGSSITVNVSEISPNTFLGNGPSGAGFVRGTFSGTLYDVTLTNSVNVSGNFNSIRLQ